MPKTDHDGVADVALLERWRAGDRKAGSVLVARHFPALHRFFSNKAGAHAEDLVQQTFVACVESRDAFRGESTFRAYLFGLARLQLYMHYRASSKKQSLDFTTTSVRDLGASPTAVCAQREEERLLMSALSHVPLEQQMALELAYWEDLTTREIAIVLGIPEDTVSSRLRRGKARLRKALAVLSDASEQRARAFCLLVGEIAPLTQRS
jgi:RNA polymerase sigma factor (sigma-70 family)